MTALSDIFENEELVRTRGLKKQCLVRLSTFVNNISIKLKAVRLPGSHTAEETKDKKKEMMVEKKGRPT